MNWDAIGAIGEIVGAVAVVATLFYLARQISDSTPSQYDARSFWVMNRKGRSAAIQAIAAGILVAGCTIPLRIVVVNTTAEAVEIAFDLGVRGDDACEPPSWNEYTPAAHLHRWFREPEWRPADAIAVDDATCTVRGTIPAHTALKLEYSIYPGIAELDGIQLSLRGSAGALTLQGAQIRRYFEEQSTGRFVLEYGGA